MGAGWVTMALITDGRFSGGTHGFVVGHYSRGTNWRYLALVQDGDMIPSTQKTILLSSVLMIKN